MTPEEMRKILDTAPPAGTLQRSEYVREKFLGLFGWITWPDTLFLIDWLPEMSKIYPKHPLQIVEVGTFGGSTARALITLTGGSKITCIDSFVDVNPCIVGQYPDGKTFWTTMLKTGVDLSSYATLIIDESAHVGSNWKDPIDLLFVDGDHAYEAAKTDITLFAPHVVVGGYCMVDDYQMPDVTRAVDEYFTNDKWKLVRLPDKNPASIIVFQRL